MQGCYKKWRQLDKNTLATWHYECDEQRCQWEQKIVNVRCNNKNKTKKQNVENKTFPPLVIVSKRWWNLQTMLMLWKKISNIAKYIFATKKCELQQRQRYCNKRGKHVKESKKKWWKNVATKL
jgi:hypothetical protein